MANAAPNAAPKSITFADLANRGYNIPQGLSPDQQALLIADATCAAHIRCYKDLPDNPKIPWKTQQKPMFSTQAPPHIDEIKYEGVVQGRRNEESLGHVTSGSPTATRATVEACSPGALMAISQYSSTSAVANPFCPPRDATHEMMVLARDRQYFSPCPYGMLQMITACLWSLW